MALPSDAPSAPVPTASAHQLRKPYLLFIGDVDFAPNAKTAYGVRDWAPDDCVAQYRLPGCTLDLGLPEMTPDAAYAAGARSLLFGAAAAGGAIPDHWLPALLRAIEAGMDIVAGMHTRLSSVAALREAAQQHGVRLVDVRVPPTGLPVGSGVKRSGKRLHTVGTDCALGKKYTALTLARALKERGVDADFRATGQTGILISGNGIPMDSVVADFVSGAAETLSPAAAPEHWDVIEGQGSLLHPSFAAVTLGLLHGSQPDALVLCHDPRRKHIFTCPQVTIPSLDVVAQRYLEAARLTNPEVQLVGVSLNTQGMDDNERTALFAETEALTQVPCFDPMLSSMDAVVDRVLTI